MKKIIVGLVALSSISAFATDNVSITLKPGQDLRAQQGNLSILVECNSKCIQVQCQYITHTQQGPFEHIRLEAGSIQGNSYLISDKVEVVCN
jgi:hypothetical protein